MRLRAVLSVAMTVALVIPSVAEEATNAVGSAYISPALEAPKAGSLIERYKRTYLYALVEYNTKNCKKISQGKWSLENPKPKYGKVTYGSISGTAASGPCAGHKYTFAAIYYEWKRHSNEAIKETVNARWKTPDGHYDEAFSFALKVKVVRPTGDKTVFAKWDSDGLGAWKQTVKPPGNDPKFDFSFDTVRESNPGGGGPDTCWFKKSAIDKFTSITGGTWFPDEKGVWSDFDHVGWFTSSVKYYRQKKRAPCGTTFPQQMQHKAQVEDDFVDYGPVNTLGGSFTKTTVTSTRAGKSKTVTR